MTVDTIFKRISKHKSLPEKEKELIRRRFTLHKFRKDEIIINQNEDCNSLFFVLKGILRIFYFNESSTEITRVFIHENEFCTNLISFTNQDINRENIQCLEDTLLFRISRDDFYEMLSESQLMTTLYSRVLEQFIKRNLEHFEFMNTLNEKQRVEKFLESSPEINSRVKDKTIATYLRVSPEYFSRTKRNFYINSKPIQ